MKSSTVRILVIAALLILLVVGAVWFLSSPKPSGAPTLAAQQQPSATPPAPTVSSPTAAPTLAPDEFVNPVLNTDFPDPDVLKLGDTYYAYATNAGPTNIQMAKSKDLVKWELLSGALPALPFWAKPQAGLTWAPDVSTTGDGKTFIMYYTSRDAASDKECIGVATGNNPEAFRSVGAANDKPLICNPAEVGDIDPASFVDDDGSRYVLWKNDGNCCAMDTWIYIQKTSGDGSTLEGQPARLMRNDQVWEGSLVEGPTLWKHNGKYYLFYSANAYNTERYAVGYAVADSVLGPYRKADKPLLQTDMKNGAAFGPGGQDIVEKNGKTWIVYHSWDPSVSLRWMQIDELVWQGDTPVVNGPTRSPHKKP